MSYREFRPCTMDGGCPQLEAELADFASKLRTQFAPIAFADMVCVLETDCQTQNNLLADRDPITKYIDGSPISHCPRMAAIQFQVLDHYNAQGNE